MQPVSPVCPSLVVERESPLPDPHKLCLHHSGEEVNTKIDGSHNLQKWGKYVTFLIQ